MHLPKDELAGIGIMPELEPVRSRRWKRRKNFHSGGANEPLYLLVSHPGFYSASMQINLKYYTQNEVKFYTLKLLDLILGTFSNIYYSDINYLESRWL